MKFSYPGKDDFRQLTRHLNLADELVSAHCEGDLLSGGKSDLDLLQRTVDIRTPRALVGEASQALSIALGRILVNNLDVCDWSIVEGELQRTVAVRHQGALRWVSPHGALVSHFNRCTSPGLHALYDDLAGQLMGSAAANRSFA